MRHFIQSLLIALGLLAVSPASAEVRALLVGVSDYEFLDADLKGPVFDVALMAQTLTARGVSPDQITMLSSAADATALPRRAEILAAMDRLATISGPEDTVVFYFSGHGSQAPDASGDEQGGADEILLPMDAKGWQGAVAQVENALLDDELAAWAKRVTATGAKLVGIIDACHSGTGFRAVSGIGTARVLPPEMLGIPDDLPAPALTQGYDISGDFAFLYSSQPDQRSFEYPLGLGADQRWYGAFTLALAQSLVDAPQASWRQVLATTRDRMTQGTARQEPDGEGTLLDAPVFGAGATTRRYSVQDNQLQAGLLQGLTEGSTVTLYAQPAEGEGLAEARLTNVAAQSAELDLVAPPPTGAAWAELTLPAPPAPLRLAPVVRADTGDYSEHEAALAMLIAEGTVTADAQSPDFIPILTGNTLALANPDGVLDPLGHFSTPRVTPRAGEDASAATLRLLENAAHATRMRSVLAGLSAGRGLSLGGQAIAMSIERAAGNRAGKDCARSGSATPFAPQTGVFACDALWLTLANTSGRVQDVTVLYLAADFTLTPLWPVRGLSNRLALGETARVGLQITHDDPTAFAEEEILVIALSPEVDEPRADLSSLATPDALRAAGSAGSALASITQLMNPTDAGQTRGFSLKRPSLSLLRQSILLKPDPT
jgi:metacaspase-1